MVFTKIDFNISYRDQDITLINKTIEKVNMEILAFFNNHIIINTNLIYSLREETSPLQPSSSPQLPFPLQPSSSLPLPLSPPPLPPPSSQRKGAHHNLVNNL